MKAMNNIKAWALVVLAAVSVTSFAQSEVRVNKLLKAQKVQGKTVLKAQDRRLPQNVVIFDNPVDVASMPQEVRDFLSSYDEALRRIDEEGADPASVLSIGQSLGTTAEVGPILGDIEFDQGTPYNNNCPIVSNARAITGCVATAMAQIMTFHQYPSVGTGTTTYTGSHGAETFVFADHPFDWNNILHTYKNGGYTAAQANAVAELMLACGASVNMNYTANASGAHSEKVLPALRDNFGYSSSMEYIQEPKNLSPDMVDIIKQGWVDALKLEFDNNRPVYYSGATQTDGHAFVMDGYKVENDTVKFHVNWGWNGSYNGWFVITNLKPQPDQKTTYSAYSNDFVINIVPKGAGIDNTDAETAMQVDMNAPVYTILGNKMPASSMQRGMIYIQNGRKFVW